MSRAKCRYCNEPVQNTNKLILFEKVNTRNGEYKEKKVFLHKYCENDYNELMEYKLKETKWFNELFEYLKQLFKYKSLPNKLITRLQDLRNGTVMVKGMGKIVKSKEGYEYEVIFDAFLRNEANIEWVLNNKSFSNEQGKINYIMTIVENNINDAYESYKIRKQVENINSLNIDEDEIKNINKHNDCCFDKNNKNTNTGITAFLEIDEL